ncbi:MAG: hypothetical protein WAM27_08075 [Nitrososphaeraceae archaeon]
MEEISTQVLSLDKRIRFAGVVTPMGEVIEGGFQEEAKPLLDQNKEQQLYLESLSAIGSLREYSDSLGDLIYNITEYRKVILPHKESKILCISLFPGTDLMNIKNQVTRLIGSRY